MGQWTESHSVWISSKDILAIRLIMVMAVGNSDTHGVIHGSCRVGIMVVQTTLVSKAIVDHHVKD